MPDIVEPTIPQYPEQGIQATLDLLYLWNPDAVQPYIEEFERLAEEMRELLENLPEVAITGSYDDLIDKPAIDGVILTKNTTKEELGLDVDLSAYRTAADQDVIDDRLERLIEGVDDGLTALENVVATKASQAALQEAITNLTNYVDSEITAGLAPVQADISDIQALIPSQASTSNQLADKNFVNSSVATNTAYFIGTFNSVAELEAYSGTLTNNDYAFVIGTDQQGNTVYNRYKYNADTQQWIFEYSLNNSSFTADQWAAINSSATSAKIEQIETNKQGLANHIADQNNPHAVTKTQVGLGNVDNTADLDKPVSTATQTALNAKQGTISDLATIRSGAEAGSTAVQPNDLATVATTGDYNDLTNKPTLGTAASADTTDFATATQGALADTAIQSVKTINGQSIVGTGDVTISGLPDQTGQSGKFLSTNGTNANWETINALQNTATDSDALTILGEPTNRYNNVNIGKNSGFYGFQGYNAPSQSIAIGNYAKVYGRYTEAYNIAIGYLARTGDTTGTSYSEFGNGNIAIGGYSVAKGDYFAGAIAIGNQAEATASRALALGWAAKATAVGAIQINGAGYATSNSTPGTLQIALGTKPNGVGWTNYRLLDSDGTIPEARLADTTNATAGQVLTLDSNLVATWATPSGGGGVPTLTWYTVDTAGNTLTIADTSSAQLVKVYKNGLLLQPTEDYSISGTTLTTVTAMVVGDKITMEVFV